MRRVNLLVLFALFGALAMPLALPTPAHATLDDPCFAEGTLQAEDGTSFGTVMPKTNSGVYTVPIKGMSSYTGGMAVDEPDEGRAYNGSIQVELPAVLGALGFKDPTIHTWENPDSTSVTADPGVVDWELPDATPRGVEMTVSGTHNDPLGSCSGSISVKVDGGLFDSPVGFVTTLATLATGAVLGLAGIPKGN